MRYREWAVFSALCLVWGSTWAVIRVLVDDVPPLQAAAVRFALAGIIALVWMLLRRERWPRGAEWRAILLLSFAMIAAPYGIIFWAERTVASGMTALVYASLPIFISFLTPLMAREGSVAVPRRAVQAMIFGVGGIALLLQSAIHVSWEQTLGIVALLVGVALSAWSTIHAKATVVGKGADLHVTMSSAWQFLLASVWLEAASLILESGQTAVWSREAVEAELFLSVFGSVVAFSLYYWLLRHWEPYRLSMMQLLFPLVAVTEGAILLHELLQWQMVVAGVVILGSVWFVMRARAEDEEMVTLRE